jgi:hypothetical protein
MKIWLTGRMFMYRKQSIHDFPNASRVERMQIAKHVLRACPWRVHCNGEDASTYNEWYSECVLARLSPQMRLKSAK